MQIGGSDKDTRTSCAWLVAISDYEELHGNDRCWTNDVKDPIQPIGVDHGAQARISPENHRIQNVEITLGGKVFACTGNPEHDLAWRQENLVETRGVVGGDDGFSKGTVDVAEPVVGVIELGDREVHSPDPRPPGRAGVLRLR